MKTTCPECGKHNFYVANGFGYCFNCFYKQNIDGSAVQDRVRSDYIEDIRALYKELAYYYHSCLSTSHRKYLLDRGITDDDITRLKIGYCPNSFHIAYKSHIAKEAGIFNKVPHLEGRIIFPYWYYDEITNLQGRAYDCTDISRKYLLPFHSSYYRGADYAFTSKIEYKGSLCVITEGPIKAILSARLFETYGLAGTNSLTKIPYPYEQYVLCFDNQRKNRKQLIYAIRRAADNYGSKVATLPLYGKDKQDIDSFILDYGLEEYRKIIEQAIDIEQWRKYA
jgi:hypothetical protein